MHLAPRLFLADPAKRYTGSTNGITEIRELAPYLDTFDKIAIEPSRKTGENITGSYTGWQQVDRLRELALATT